MKFLNSSHSSSSVDVRSPARKGSTAIFEENRSTFDEFILWSAMPKTLRPLAMQSVEQFAEHFTVSDRTLYRWQKRAEFWPSVKEIRDNWAKGKTGEVINAIYLTAISGRREAPQSQKLWMEVIEGHSDKLQVEHKVTNVTLSPSDIRFIIDNMPEPERSKFYGYLREIVDFANALRRAGRLDDRTAPEQYDAAPDDVQGQADHDAQKLPGKETDAVAESDPSSLRRHLGERCEREARASSRDHQGAAWWREV